MAVKEQSQRQLRVGQEIKKIIASALERGEIHSLDFANTIITITEVRVSPDLKHATAYVMTLNGDNLSQVIDMLNGGAWLFKKQIAAKLELRYIPDLNFKSDDTFAEVDKIEQLLRHPKVAQDLTNENQEDLATE